MIIKTLKKTKNKLLSLRSQAKASGSNKLKAVKIQILDFFLAGISGEGSMSLMFFDFIFSTSDSKVGSQYPNMMPVTKLKKQSK